MRADRTACWSPGLMDGGGLSWACQGALSSQGLGESYNHGPCLWEAMQAAREVPSRTWAADVLGTCCFLLGHRRN